MQNSTQRMKNLKSEIHLFIREKMLTISGWNFEIWAVQKYVNRLDLAKSFHTSMHYVLAKIGFDTSENEALKVWRWFNLFFQFTPYRRRNRELTAIRLHKPPALGMLLHLVELDQLLHRHVRGTLHGPYKRLHARLDESLRRECSHGWIPVKEANEWMDHRQTLRGSFSAVSKPIFASK